MKYCVTGSRSFGVAAYRALRDAHGLPAAVFAPAGDALHTFAALDGIPVLSPDRLRADQVPADCDLLVCAHSHYYVSTPARHRFRLGAIGYHPSLLPLHRGRDAVRWTIRMNDRITGGTVYWLNDTVDGGPIALQQFVHVYPGENASQLWRRALFPMGVRMLLDVFEDVKAGRIVRVPQDPALATWEPSMTGAPPLFRPELIALGAGPAVIVTPGAEQARR